MLNIITGFLSGIISGMGIGGGAILIPALNIFAGVSQKTAQGINLTYFIPTAIAAIIVHIKNKSIDIRKAAVLGICGLPGAIGGAALAAGFNDNGLRKIFGVFLLVVGIYEIYKGVKLKS